MRPRHVALACLLSSIALPGWAATRHGFAIPAGPLDQALRLAAVQGGANIGFSGIPLAGVPTPAVAGRMTTAAALRKLLRHAPFTAHEILPDTFRIDVVPRPAIRPTIRPARPAPRPTATAPPIAPDPAAIVVVASKRSVALAAYPGAATIVSLADTDLAGARDIGTLAGRTPLLQSTAFGPGRDKLFVRGIADSSFAGPTQATVGSYFGETRLYYNGSDPDLRLIDMDRIEILQGPQGTLYGAGAIGGIVRLLPRRPDLTAASGSVQASIATTREGRASYEGAATLNLPLVGDVAAIRAVTYRSRDGGYVDDSTRQRHDVNGSDATGGRIALRIAPAPRWTLDIGGLAQATRTANPQYAVRRPGPLTLDANLAQPFADDYLLGSVTLAHDGTGDAPSLLATIGGVRRETRLRYDATRPNTPPRAYDEHGQTRLFSGEVRLWRTAASGLGWLIGASAVQNRETTRRQLGPTDAPRDIVGVDNRSVDLALFGEATLPLSPALSTTAGLRVSHARMDGQPLAARPQSPFIRGQGQTRADPTFGVVLTPWDGVHVYGRYGRGYRTGGLAVAAMVGRVAIYAPDAIAVGEAGVRLDRLLDGRATARIGVARAVWNRIQADLVGGNGFPFTANIGDGRVTTVEATLGLAVTPRLRVDASGLWAHSALIDPSPPFAASRGQTLPETPRVSANAAFAWTLPVGGTRDWSLTGNLHRQGRSRLGVGPMLDIEQDGYLSGAVALTATRGGQTITLGVENVGDAHGDRFAIGNPFQLQGRNQFTPLRPRTVRLSLRQAF